MRVAVVQLNSQDKVPENLARVRHWVSQAAAAGSQLVVLPENFAFMGEEAQKREIAERIDRHYTGPIVGALREEAAKRGVWLLGGGMPEASDDPARPYNTSVLIDRKGELAATYRKVHLFDVSLPDGTSLRESAATSAGSQAVTAEVLGVRVGLSICYDVRFPELYRVLAARGAEVIAIPSAFTLATTRDHWEPLLRARAIENQCFVVAPNQIGPHPPGPRCGGRSMIVDPWGLVLAQAPDTEAAIVADLDFEMLERVRRRIPALTHRRPSAYGWSIGWRPRAPRPPPPTSAG
jgi:deaminated glutathione amidase